MILALQLKLNQQVIIKSLRISSWGNEESSCTQGIIHKWEEGGRKWAGGF